MIYNDMENQWVYPQWILPVMGMGQPWVGYGSVIEYPRVYPCSSLPECVTVNEKVSSMLDELSFLSVMWDGNARV